MTPHEALVAALIFLLVGIFLVRFCWKLRDREKFDGLGTKITVDDLPYALVMTDRRRRLLAFAFLAVLAMLTGNDHPRAVALMARPLLQYWCST
jgi:hypothetical protein